MNSRPQDSEHVKPSAFQYLRRAGDRIFASNDETNPTSSKPMDQIPEFLSPGVRLKLGGDADRYMFAPNATNGPSARNFSILNVSLPSTPSRFVMAGASNASGEVDEDSKSKLRRVQQVAAAIEQGLKEQRDQLQHQLDLSAQREALLQARISQLQERMVLEESVWIELKSNPRTSPEALALKLRRAREALRWAERAEADERQQRMAAEALVSQLKAERDSANLQLMQMRDHLDSLQKERVNNVSIIDSSSILHPHSFNSQLAERADQLREQGSPEERLSQEGRKRRQDGRKRLESALKNFQTRQAHRQLNLSDSWRNDENSNASDPQEPRQGQRDSFSPVSPIPDPKRSLHRSYQDAGEQESIMSRPGLHKRGYSWDVGTGDRLLSRLDEPGRDKQGHAASLTTRALQDPQANPSASTNSRERQEEDCFAGHVSSSGSSDGSKSSSSELKVGAPVNKLSISPSTEQERWKPKGMSANGSARFSLLGHAGHSGCAENGSWWKGVGGEEDVSECEEHVTAAGTITYTNNEDAPTNEDDTAPSVSNSSSSNDSSQDCLPDPPQPAEQINDLGGLARERSKGEVQGEDNYGKTMMRSSTPPSSYGQLLCSLPEAKPVLDFPISLDSTSSPPSSARALWRMGSNRGLVNPVWSTESEQQEEEKQVGSGDPAPPSSTDSLIQGLPTNAWQRGLPQGVKLQPARDGDDVAPSPFPSTGSSVGNFPHHLSARDGGDLLPSVSSLASSTGGGSDGREALLRYPMPPPIIQPQGHMLEISPFPSSASLSGQFGRMASASLLLGEQQALKPQPAANMEISPFPSASSLLVPQLHRPPGDVITGSPVLRQAAAALDASKRSEHETREASSPHSPLILGAQQTHEQVMEEAEAVPSCPPHAESEAAGDSNGRMASLPAGSAAGGEQSSQSLIGTMIALLAADEPLRDRELQTILTAVEELIMRYASSAGSGEVEGREVLSPTSVEALVRVLCGEGAGSRSNFARQVVRNLAFIAADVAGREAIVQQLQSQHAALHIISKMLSEESNPSDEGSSIHFHLLMLIGNLLINSTGRKLILAQGGMVQQLLRFLWFDEIKYVKTLRFTTGALRSLAADAWGRELISNGGYIYSASQLSDRLQELRFSSDVNTVRYVNALVKRLEGKS